MISELRDEEILEFLMTSEFEGDYSPEELKYLLIKWRYFYRLANGKIERVSTDSEGTIRKLNADINLLNNRINNLLVENTNKDNLVNSLKSRKLTFKERWSGKINNENEN
jgi:ABC-type Zn uptake system ZnuABC Zn-binding protein ZnuA